jgi:hypothetical protein
VAEERGGFLPPEPPGPEPELGDRRTRHDRPAPAGPPAAPPPPAPGSEQAGPPYEAPPCPHEAPPRPHEAPPRPHEAPSRYGWQQPAPPGWQAPPWGYPPGAREPDNGPAVAGFVLSLVAGGLLIFSLGLSSIVSLGCAVAGLIYSRKGRQKVDAGETTKNRSLAQAGYVISIVSLVLSALAAAFWVLVFVLAIVDEDFQRDLENEFDGSETISSSARAAAAAVRAGINLLG